MSKTVHVVHHGDPSSHPFRKDPKHPRKDRKVTPKKLIEAVDRDPIDFIFNFILGWMAK